MVYRVTTETKLAIQTYHKCFPITCLNRRAGNNFRMKTFVEYIKAPVVYRLQIDYICLTSI